MKSKHAPICSLSRTQSQNGYFQSPYHKRQSVNDIMAWLYEVIFYMTNESSIWGTQAIESLCAILGKTFNFSFLSFLLEIS